MRRELATRITGPFAYRLTRNAVIVPVQRLELALLVKAAGLCAGVDITAGDTPAAIGRGAGGGWNL